ncbi:hypothetical protein ACKTEK_13195 [Tepidamorphus sp. 3E244]|uniref:hypothetical protein n=1 Tax=Tepidamorphus sp. 3E244 TaxID=3385498 RepID=UPI0038FCC47E
MSLRAGGFVLCTMLALTVAFVSLSYMSRKAGLRDQLGVHVRHLVAAGIDNRSRHDLFDMMEFGENVARSTPVRGGRVLDAIGAELGVFGQAPFMTWKQAALMEVPQRFHSSSRNFEIYLSADDMRLDHGLIILYDASDLHSELLSDVLQVGFAGLLLSMGLALVTCILFSRQVLRPVQSITAAIETSLEAADDAPGSLMVDGIQGKELARLCEAINDLMFISYANATSGFDGDGSAIDDVPFPALSLSEHGFIVAANGPALELFRAKDEMGVASAIEGGNFTVEGRKCDAASLASMGELDTTGELRFEKDGVPVLVSSRELKRADGSARGYTLALADVRELVSDMRGETERRRETEQALGQARSRLADYRRLFDACIILLDSSASDPGETAFNIMPELLITSWLTELTKSTGAPRPDVQHNSLPPLKGCMSSLRKVFGFALAVIWARSLQGEPALLVQGTREGDGAQFVLREIRKGDPARAMHAADSAEAPIMIGAMGRILAKNGGRLVRAAAGRDMDLNEIAFTVPLDVASAERLVTETDAPEDDLDPASDESDVAAA